MTVITGPLMKLAFGGSLFVNEEWACSIHFAGINAERFVFNDDLGPMVAPLTDWMQRQTSMINPNARLEFIKFNEIAKGPSGPGLPGGRQVGDRPTSEILLNPAIAPGTIWAPAPAQLSSVVSLRSDVPRGRGSVGRFYPPTSHLTNSGSGGVDDGRLTAGAAKGMADSAQELLSELNALSDGLGPWGAFPANKFVAVVWSGVAQTANSIERVAVGRVIDTQRRRRSSLDEDPQFATANV